MADKGKENADKAATQPPTVAPTPSPSQPSQPSQPTSVKLDSSPSPSQPPSAKPTSSPSPSQPPSGKPTSPSSASPPTSSASGATTLSDDSDDSDLSEDESYGDGKKKRSAPLSKEGPRAFAKRDFSTAIRMTFGDVGKMSRVNFDAIMAMRNLNALAAKSPHDLDTLRMEAISHLIHFAEMNRHILGDHIASSLSFFSCAAGNTSQGKDTISAMLIGKPEMGVTGVDMMTAANVFLSCNYSLHNHPPQDEITAMFRNNKICDKGNAQEYRKKLKELFESIRQGNQRGTAFSTDQVVVRNNSATPVFPTFILNTIGSQPTSDSSQDDIFAMMNSLLNNQNQREGGVLLLCHELNAPLDNSASWTDLDVVKLLTSKPEDCKFKIILALTKGDRLGEGLLDSASTMREAHRKIFGKFEKYLPSAYVDMYLVTGWTSENPPFNIQATEKKMVDAFDEAMTRIIRDRPEEAISEYYVKLQKQLKFENLNAAYQRELSQHSSVHVDIAKQGLDEGEQAIRKKLEQLHIDVHQCNSQSLAGVCEQFCMEVQKVAAQFRLGTLDRPASSAISLDDMRLVAKSHRKSLLEELENPRRHLSPTASALLNDALSKDGLEMNSRGLHTFWSKITRAKSNVQTFVNLFSMKPLKREELNAWIRAEPVRNIYDVQNFQMMCVLAAVRTVWIEQLVPLLSEWLATAVHDSYVCACESIFAGEEFASLKDNKRFTDSLRIILKVLN